jgi:predicted NAD/FAD-binding protein
VREIGNFPAELFIGFFLEQGPLRLTDRLQWQTLEGGSQSYVKAILRTFKTKVRTGEKVEEVRRKDTSDPGQGVTLRTREGKEYSYDKVVMACHADEALSLLVEPTDDERRLLSAWNYQKNNTVLHTDRDVLPPRKRARASWNYFRERETTMAQPACVNYHMNRIQGLDCREQYFVTLNRVRPIPEKYVLKEIYFTHPTFTRAAVESQKELPNLNGVKNTYFCGNYFGNGFYESAVESAVAVARCFDLDL